MATHSDFPEKLQGPADNATKWLLKRIWKRVNHKNMHFMGCIVGEEGSGKSHTAIRIADEVDPTFTADRVIFEVSSLLRVLRDGDHQPGQFYVLDEAGVQFGNRTWQERSQVLANQALQLIRNHNLGLIFTLPVRAELDVQTDHRLQAVYEISEKEPDEYVRGRWVFLDIDRLSRDAEEYTHFPRRTSFGTEYRYQSVAFKPPRAELIGPYEERKQEFQAGFYDEVLDDLEEDADDDEDAIPETRQIAMDIIENDAVGNYVMLHSQNKTPYINEDLIHAERGIDKSDAKVVKSLLEKECDLSKHV